MFRKKKKKGKNTYSSISLQNQLELLASAQKDLLFKLQSRKIYDIDESGLPPLDFSKKADIEYIDGLFLKDLSTDEQVIYGLSVFHAEAMKDIFIPKHIHDTRYQLIFVLEGAIINEVQNITYNAGESMFINKKETHSIACAKGTKMLLIYIPITHAATNKLK